MAIKHRAYCAACSQVKFCLSPFVPQYAKWQHKQQPGMHVQKSLCSWRHISRCADNAIKSRQAWYAHMSLYQRHLQTMAQYHQHQAQSMQIRRQANPRAWLALIRQHYHAGNALVILVTVLCKLHQRTADPFVQGKHPAVSRCESQNSVNVMLQPLKSIGTQAVHVAFAHHGSCQLASCPQAAS